MSDELLMQPSFSHMFPEGVDECAPTERGPGSSPMLPGAEAGPARGVALSVLWWLESDAAS